MGLPRDVRIEPLSQRTIRGAIEVKNAGWWDVYEPWLGTARLERMDAAIERTVGVWEAGLEQGKLLPTWVAVDDSGRVVGVAGGGPAEVVDAVPNRLAGERAAGATHELAVLYVAADRRGQGIAEELVREVIGDDPAQLWVLEENPRAQAFYAKVGFAADGGVEELPAEWNGAREIRMVRA